MRNFCGTAGSSVNHQPEMSAVTSPRFFTSTESLPVAGFASSRFTTTRGIAGGSGSSPPGEPPMFVLARQFFGLSGEPLSARTSVKPKPFAAAGQPSSVR